MIHYRDDYTRIQDPKGKIGDDEPVFLIRCKDKHFIKMVRHYALLYAEEKGTITKDVKKVYDSIMRFSEFGKEWQKKNGCQSPTIPTKKLRS